MARFEVDIFNKCVEVDLHGYSHTTAIQVAREKIKEAYGRGLRHVRLIHGAADIKNKEDGGSIKFALRKMLARGEFDKWVEREKCKLNDGSMRLALRKNPEPADGEWSEMPADEY